MSFLTAELVAQLVGYAVKYGPTAARALLKVFSKPQVSTAELDAAFEVAELSYEQLIHPEYPSNPVS